MFFTAAFLMMVVVVAAGQSCQPPADGEPCKYPQACLCPKLVPPCKERVPRFFFNATTHACEPFEWGGCKPNCNNFETYEECKRNCGQLSG